MFYSVELENQSLENQIKDEKLSFRLLALFKSIRAVRGTERPHVLHTHITDQLKLSSVKLSTDWDQLLILTKKVISSVR